MVLNNLLCLDMSETRSSDPPRLMKCHGSGGSQQWTFGVRNLPDGGGRCEGSWSSLQMVVLSVQQPTSHLLFHIPSRFLLPLYPILAVSFFNTSIGGGFSLLYFQRSNRLYQVSVGQCLRAVDPLSHKGSVAMAICDGSPSQQWHLES